MSRSGIGIIIQARTGSTRLPNKILLPFYGTKNILELLIDKIKYATSIPIIIATTDKESDDVISNIGKKLNVNIFRGSEYNVLQRFVDAAEKHKIKDIIRICSDNPFLDYSSLNYLINSQDKSDYLCFAVKGTPSITTHYGFWAERVKLSTLKKVSKLTSDPLYLEHVTNFIYTHSDEFNITKIEVDSKLIDLKLRLTLDTKEDFLILKQLYESLRMKHGISFGIKEIIKLLELNNHYIKQMKLNIEANAK